MSQDLIFKTLKKSWARDDLSYKPILAASPTSPKIAPTAAEKARLEKLATLRMRAESGDEKAKKEWQAVLTKVVALRVRARGGDPKAVRACQILEESGVFGKSQKISAREGAGRKERSSFSLGSFTGSEEIFDEFVGDEERLSLDAGQAERAAASRICGASPWPRSRGRRARRLRRLAWKSARGDAAATARLQQVTSRLQQRSSAGDARAAALLQQVQSMQSQAQARLTSQPATAPVVTTPPPGAPPAAAPPLNVTYAAPVTDYGDDYDEY